MLKNQKKSNSARGGARPGAGRKKGARNQKSRLIAEKAMEAGITPLEYLLNVLRDEDQDMRDRFAAATAAAPYVHPRLAAVQHSGDQENPFVVQTVQMVVVDTENDNDEWDAEIAH